MYCHAIVPVHACPHHTRVHIPPSRHVPLLHVIHLSYVPAYDLSETS